MSSRGRPRQFSVDQMLDAALELIEQDGVDSLSMSSLAKKLGTGSATLYNYVRSRDELIDTLLGRSLTEAPPLPRAEGIERWDDALVGYLVAGFRAFVDRPALLTLWHSRPYLHLGAALRTNEELALLEGVGFSPERAAEVYLMLAAQQVGHLVTAAALAQRPDTAVAPAGSTIGAAQRHLDSLGMTAVYELAVRALVDSLVAELASRSRP